MPTLYRKGGHKGRHRLHSSGISLAHRSSRKNTKTTNKQCKCCSCGSLEHFITDCPTIIVEGKESQNNAHNRSNKPTRLSSLPYNQTLNNHHNDQPYTKTPRYQMFPSSTWTKFHTQFYHKNHAMTLTLMQ
jgi:hypothetical protein